MSWVFTVIQRFPGDRAHSPFQGQSSQSEQAYCRTVVSKAIVGAPGIGSLVGECLQIRAGVLICIRSIEPVLHPKPFLAPTAFLLLTKSVVHEVSLHPSSFQVGIVLFTSISCVPDDSLGQPARQLLDLQHPSSKPVDPAKVRAIPPAQPHEVHIFP